ncbi:MAG: META domain-containing protein [Chloroflexi bacterium]|nr:META domain-containing protein [Chloroflexota bacterium]
MNNGIKLRLTITTLIWCSEALNQTEGRYLAALETAHEFAVTENQLAIQYDEGKIVLKFTGVAPTTASTPPFESSRQVTPVAPPVVKHQEKRQ